MVTRLLRNRPDKPLALSAFEPSRVSDVDRKSIRLTSARKSSGVRFVASDYFESSCPGTSSSPYPPGGSQCGFVPVR